MGEQEIEDRCMAVLSGIKIGACRALRTGHAFESKFQKYNDHYIKGLEKFNDLSMMIYAKGSISTVDVKELAARYHNDIDIICLDYIQQVVPSSHHQNVCEKVDEISRACKQIATKYNIPVIAVAQLSRQANTEERVQIHHLKESSGIEQDSDYVILLYREKEDKMILEPLEVNLAKNRHGMLGITNLSYELDLGDISEA